MLEVLILMIMGNVGVKHEFAAGSVRAVGALKGLFARVPLHMILQRSDVRKARGAVRAVVRLVTNVGVIVVLHVPEKKWSSNCTGSKSGSWGHLCLSPPQKLAGVGG